MHNLTLGSLNNRLSNNMNKASLSITMRLRCCNAILRRKHHNVTKEVGIMSFRVVITLIGNNRITIVNQCTTSTKVISNLRGCVIVQTITTERPTRFSYYNFTACMNHLTKAIIM